MRKLIVLLSLLCVAVGMDAQSKWQLIPHLGGNVTKLFGHEKSGSDMGKFFLAKKGKSGITFGIVGLQWD